MDDWELLRHTAAGWGLSLAPERIAGMRAFYELLLAGNQKANLTRITGTREAVIKHFLDALTVLVALGPGACEAPRRMLDVGAGAGIPGIPLLLACPGWHGTLLEATGKKVAFMQEAIQALELPATAVHGRAEERARESGERECYDLVVARAVAELNVLAELCLPFVRPGGHFVAMKGAQIEEELPRATKAIALLGGATRDVVRLELPEGHGDRALVVISKLTPTPGGYPRRTGIPAAKPLC